jgi:hypothetical protein
VDLTFASDDGASQLADDLADALHEYARLYGGAARIASGGGSLETIAEWAYACFAEALSLRLLEQDSIGFVDGAPEDAGVLVRELYESLVVLSGVERPAHTLSMPVGTCADGSSLATLVREKGELARWLVKIGRPLALPEMPMSTLAAGQRAAADADRETTDDERSRDLNDVFAGRIAEAVRLYGDAIASVDDGSSSADARVESAREEAPALLGFARLADRRTLGLDPPSSAAPVARLVADGFLTLAAAETPEDLATLPYPDAEEVEIAVGPLRNWLGRLGTV